MVFLYVLAFIYTAVGFVYALYILFNGIDAWYVFPLNFVFGPIALLYNYYKFFVKKDIPRIR